MEEQPNKDFPNGTITYSVSLGTEEYVCQSNIGMNAGFEITPRWFPTGRPAFINPTTEKPMKASDFLGRLNLSSVLESIKERYGKKEWHFHYPVEAMIKSQIFKYIKGLRWDTALLNHLKQYPTDAQMLGFEIDETGTPKLPSQQTMSHFVKTRMRQEGLYDIFDSLVMAIREEMAARGIQLGKTIGVDSTPMKSLRNDKDAAFNPHYNIKGYKIHGAVDLDHFLPLTFNFTTATDGDSPQYLPLLDRLHMLGITFNGVYADGAYASFENFAIVNHHYRARTVFNLREDAKISPLGTPAGIKKQYNLLWKCDGFKPDAGLEYMLYFLMWHQRYDVVGAYYRNKHIKEWEKNYDATKTDYNKRAGIEAFHGHLKQQMNIEKFLDKKGIQNAEIHVLLCYISLLAVALCRLQHGITDGLVNVKCLV